MLTYLRNLRLEHWGWLHVKLALLLWGFLYLFYTPTAPKQELGTVLITLQSIFTISGALIAIAGFLISTDLEPVKRFKGIRIELVGLIFAIGGPLVYGITQIYLACTLKDGSQRIALSAFAYLVVALLLGRTIVVFRFLRR